MNEEIESDDINLELAAAWDAVNGAGDPTESDEGLLYDPVDEPVEPIAAQDENNFSEEVEYENPEPISQEAANLDQSPVGLSPEAREEWANTPPAIKEHLARNEQRMEGMAQKFGANSKRAEAMDRSLAPYSQLFAMHGGGNEVLPALLQSASQLQMGSGPQKAQVVAGIIKQFGVDIRTLDSLLVGEAPPPEVQRQSEVQLAVQQAVAPYQQHMQQFEQQQQQQQQHVQNQIAGEVNNFGAQNEFYNDVRSEMADLMDMAANRNRQMSMDEAYYTACVSHPQISKIIHARVSQQSVQKKQRAASSVHGNSGGSMSSNTPGSVEAALNLAWDNAGRM
tara:strand:- start:9757 stop:10767 length:1011 start_codon:yes stop_codon:yes gene_type:complete